MNGRTSGTRGLSCKSMSHRVDLSHNILHPRTTRRNNATKFTISLRNKERQEEIMQLNSDKSFLVERKASTVNLESVAKSTISSCISLNHCKAACNPRASPTPTPTETVQGCEIVLARTKVPSELRTQTPIHVRLWWEKKAASILHLYRLDEGGCHKVLVRWCEVEVPVFAAIAWWEDERDAEMSGAFANCQSVTMFRARSTTTTLDSVTSSRTLRLGCYHRLQMTVDRRWSSSIDNFSSREEIALETEVVWDRACCTELQSPVLFHTWIAKGQTKKHAKDPHK